MMSGAGLTLFKHVDYKVYPILGMILSAVACGLYTLMTPTTPSYALVGNLILGGLGGGIAIMVPMIVAQASVDVKDVATATSSMQFFQSIAGLLCIAIMQSYFNQRVADLVPTQAEIMAEAMAGVPMDAIKASVTAAYAKAVTSTFYISIAGAVAGALVACLFRWVPLGEVHAQAAAAEKAAADDKAAAKNAALKPFALEAEAAEAAAAAAAAAAKAPETPVVVSV